MTYRELFIRYQAKLLHDWDQIAALRIDLHSAVNRLISLQRKLTTKEKSVTYNDVHPLRESKDKRIKVEVSDLKDFSYG